MILDINMLLLTDVLVNLVKKKKIHNIKELIILKRKQICKYNKISNSFQAGLKKKEINKLVIQPIGQLNHIQLKIINHFANLFINISIQKLQDKGLSMKLNKINTQKQSDNLS